MSDDRHDEARRLRTAMLDALRELGAANLDGAIAILRDALAEAGP